MKKIQITMTDREHAAVLAVLRVAEELGLERLAQMVPGIDDIAANAGELQPLTQEELGALADRVNEEAVELTESGKPRHPSVMTPWMDRINAAYSALGDAQIIYVPNIDPAGNAEEYRGQRCMIAYLGTDATKESDYDEDYLPYFRVEFADGGELDASEEELFSHDPRFLELLSAVSGGFVAARNLGFMGPRDLSEDGDISHKEEFLVAMKAFKVTECAQKAWTPAEFRRPAREQDSSPSP